MTQEEYDRRLLKLARMALAASEAGDFTLALLYVAEMLDYADRNGPEGQTSFSRRMEQQARRLAMRLFSPTLH
jgi:hypothetical protein